ncbi:MAG TPA: hypothetical protein PLI79_09085 [Mycobacterium sp.]|nr:hypothetical protein [Mycobacterium sp.]
MTAPQPIPQPYPILNEQQRAAILDQRLMAMAASGGRVETRLATSAVVVTGKSVNHILHLLLSVFLCGWWIPGWLLFTAFSGERRQTISVDEYGRITGQKAPMEASRVIAMVAAGLVCIPLFFISGSFVSACTSSVSEDSHSSQTR